MQKAKPVVRAQYIREKLKTNPNATASEVREMWIAEGHPAKIAPANSQFYGIRLNMIEKGEIEVERKRGARARKFADGEKAKNGRRKKSKNKIKIGTLDTLNRVIQVEDLLDQLIQEARQLENSQLLQNLREARRTLYTTVMQ